MTARQRLAWSRFLDHAEGCLDCRTGQRCATGNQLYHAAREEARAAAAR